MPNYVIFNDFVFDLKFNIKFIVEYLIGMFLD